MENSVGFGLIGCGVWGQVHAQTFSSSPYSKLIAVCDSNLERAEKLAKQYNVPHYYNDIGALLCNNAVNAVSIVTPDFTHSELILSALEEGKHVIVEKPLATNIEDCEKIIKTRDKKKLKLMVNYSNRWKIPFIHIRRMFNTGELGEMLMMNLKLNDTLYVPTKMLSWASKSNSLHFLGTHLIDLIRWMFGSEVERAYSVSRSVVLQGMGINTPDFFQSILEFRNGSTAYMENSWIISESAPSIFEFKAEFVGSKSTVKVNISHHRMIEKYTMEGASMPDVSDQYSMLGEPQGQASIKHFIESIVNDTEPLVTGEDGFEAVKVVSALERSVKSGKPITL